MDQSHHLKVSKPAWQLLVVLCCSWLVCAAATAQRSVRRGLDCSQTTSSGCIQCGYAFGTSSGTAASLKQASAAAVSHGASQRARVLRSWLPPGGAADSQAAAAAPGLQEQQQLTTSADAIVNGSPSCEACNASGHYRLVAGPSGTGHCECTPGYGAVLSTQSDSQSPAAALAVAAWAQQAYPTSFTCQACGPNQVPFLPGSNLQAKWNESSSSWQVTCMDPARGQQQQQAGGGKAPTDDTPFNSDAAPPGSNPLPKGFTQTAAASKDHTAPAIAAAAAAAVAAAPPAAVSLEAGASGNRNHALRAGAFTTASAAVLLPGSQGHTSPLDPAAARPVSAAAATPTTGGDAVAAWYQAGSRAAGGGSSSTSSDQQQQAYAPWLPGQCVDCGLVGGKADPTGTFCVCALPPRPSSEEEDDTSPVRNPPPPPPADYGAPSGPAPVVGFFDWGRSRRRLLMQHDAHVANSEDLMAASAVAATHPSTPFQAQAMTSGEPAVGAQAMCTGDANPTYFLATYSRTHCQLRVLPSKLSANTTMKICTAFFISRNMVVTAGRCLMDTNRPGSYDVNVNFFPGYVCCTFNSAGGCYPDSRFLLKAWVTTSGFWQSAGVGQQNDGAVLLVEPDLWTDVSAMIKPEPIGISTYNPGGVPKMVVGNTGFPCGTPPATDPIKCTTKIFPDPPSQELSDCLEWKEKVLGPDAHSISIEQFCQDGTVSVDDRKPCCDCPGEDACVGTTFPTTCIERHQWRAEQAPITVDNVPADIKSDYIVPWSSSNGELLVYMGPSCGGDYGGPLIDVQHGHAFGVAIARSSDCVKTGNRGLKLFAQFVDRGQAAGVWVGALARALVPYDNTRG